MSPVQDEVRYQVFVSSTFTDLKEEREKVLQALLECKAFPTGMELFPSADEEQFEFIKREIDSSDYYIVIIAGRYGSVAEDGVGYTEKEYDYAISCEKPVLTFLHEDIGQLPGTKLETSDIGRRRLDAFRGKVRQRRLVNFYRNPDDLKAKVLNSLNQQFQIKPMRGWMRAGQTSRADLERIADLQQNVLSLTKELAQLRSLSDEAAEATETGKQLVSWIVDLGDIEPKVSPVPAFEVTASWDELLVVVFPAGSSYRRTNSIRRAILGWLIEKAPKGLLPREIEEKSLHIANSNSGSSHFEAVDSIFNNMHRQFAGLGLIDEIRETEYQTPISSFALLGVNSPAEQPRPVTVTRWRLTRRGEHHLAKLAGLIRPRGVVVPGTTEG
jgi:hypothetical protein